MNLAIVLSGGTGTRVGRTTPKQYIKVCGKAVIMYCIETLNQTECIDAICVVAAPEWQKEIKTWIDQSEIRKFIGFADAGISRQHSIISGLNFCKGLNPDKDSTVLIHDAARPNVTKRLINDCFEMLKDAAGVLPIIAVKDTMYISKDKRSISGLLNREEIFSGQAPELFRFFDYYYINQELTEEEICSAKGTTEVAIRKGLKVNLVEGDENNYKITTAADLEKFINQKERLDS